MVAPRISNHSGQEMSSFQELIGELSLSRSAILKAWDGTLEGLRWHTVAAGSIVSTECQSQSSAQAMVFCVDRSMSSLTIAQKIGASITEASLASFQTYFFVLSDVNEWLRTSGIIVCFSDGSFSVVVFDKAQSGLTTQQLVARMYLLNDVRQTSPNPIGCILLCLSPCPACADLMNLAVPNLITCFFWGSGSVQFTLCRTQHDIHFYPALKWSLNWPLDDPKPFQQWALQKPCFWGTKPGASQYRRQFQDLLPAFTLYLTRSSGLALALWHLFWGCDGETSGGLWHSDLARKGQERGR